MYLSPTVRHRHRLLARVRSLGERLKTQQMQVLPDQRPP
jgi:hypothetical protein